MKHTLDKKKIFYIILALVTALIFIIYLVLMFQKGIRYDGHFLRRVEENHWEGNVYGLPMTITKTASDDNNIALTFSRDGETLFYSVVYDEAASPKEQIKIYSDEDIIFTGYWAYRDWENKTGWLLDSLDNAASSVTIVVNNHIDEDAWIPTNSQIASIALLQVETLHGQPAMLLIIILFAIILALDIIFPKLFFYLRYSFAVDNPEPSQFYYQMQIFGRVILCFGIVCLMIMSFH